VLVLLAVIVTTRIACAQVVPKVPPPISVVVFDSPAAYEDDLPKTVVETRDALRNDPRFEVLFFNPDTPTFVLAAKQSSTPISLKDVSSEAEQESIASAVGAAFYVVVNQTDRKRVTVAVMRVGDATTSVTTKSESPKDAATDIAGLIENWKLTETPLPKQAALAAVPASPSVPSAPPALNSGQAAQVSSPTLDAGESMPDSTPLETVEAPTEGAPSPVQSASPAEPKIVTVTPPITTAAPIVPQIVSLTPTPVSVPTSTPVPNIARSSVPPVPATDAVLVTSTPAAIVPDSHVPTASMGGTISTDAQSLIDQGDTAMHSSDSMTAIGLYQKAVDLAPRAAAPRLKLAQAYLDAGMKDEATDEARRALAIDPSSTDVQSFIQSQDKGAGGANGDVIVAQAKTESDPNNPNAWISLGDAYWNAGDADDSLISYQHAADIDPSAITPQTRLAKLYAARAQYDESLKALQKSGSDGYPFALRIIGSRSESLVGDMDDETQDFIKGQDTRETFYNKISATNMQAQGLADFVSKVSPPQQYKISHLHRELSTRLLAQATAVWIDYAETNNSTDTDQANVLEKHAIDEMKLADVAEDLQSRINP
jgi:tetratricopeptide (TPR) repeat protein